MLDVSRTTKSSRRARGNVQPSHAAIERGATVDFDVRTSWQRPIRSFARQVAHLVASSHTHDSVRPPVLYRSSSCGTESTRSCLGILEGIRTDDVLRDLIVPASCELPLLLMTDPMLEDVASSKVRIQLIVPMRHLRVIVRTENSTVSHGPI